MTPEEIRNECNLAYDVIKMAEGKLEKLRAECKHEVTERVNYQWRVGATVPADCCVYCGAVVKPLFSSIPTLKP